MVNYWHMQMHPDDLNTGAKNIHLILEQRKIIGLGEWPGGESARVSFTDEMKVNDIVAIKNGKSLIALVQIIGGSYTVTKDEDENTEWIKYRRPIRILDWEVHGGTIPQPMGTLNKCVDDEAKTTQIIKDWHNKVISILKKRGIQILV